MRFYEKIILILFTLISAGISAADFIVTSSTIKNGGTLTNKHVFNGFGCTGENISPLSNGKMLQREQRVLRLLFMIPMLQPEVDGGTGLWLIFRLTLLI